MELNMKVFFRIIALSIVLLMFFGAVACSEPMGTETEPVPEENESSAAVGDNLDGETDEKTETTADGDVTSDPQSGTQSGSAAVDETTAESDTADTDATSSDTETTDKTCETEAPEQTDETDTESVVFVPEIVEIDGTARVTTSKGLIYTATGYKSVSNGAFIFDTGLEITFKDGRFASAFNRLTFNYKSSEPIKLFITYIRDGEEKTDYFFLEATKTSFRGLIEGYLADKKGTELKKLTVDTCEKVEASFFLEDLDSEIIPLYEDDLCIENDRYKIGVRLSWGGAMTYFEDKLDGDEELGNLVNIHDTGRLIQQSFYGTYTNNDTDSLFGEGYVSVPNGDSESATKWPYNPVQGGDRKNNGSDRLIDVEYDEENDYIYIVSQSLDWAYVKGATYETIYDGLTYTYYENTYTIMEGEYEGADDDYVLVQNVMTDFSGWEHVAGGQEIPAVYLVSYFDTFSFYNGTKPWIGDTEGVYYESDLKGWDNAKNFPLFKGNTETWSIWLNTTETAEGGEDFGFGTYCPNIQRHIAIRHQYDGSKDPMANSTSYVAPSCSIVMQSYKPIEYSYILATGSFEQIRNVFTDNKYFTANPSLSEDRYDQLLSPEKYDMMNMDFSVESYKDVFNSPKHIATSYDSAEEALKLYIDNGNDPYVSLNFDWNSDKVIIAQEDFNTIEITYMLPETNSKASDVLVLFLSAGDQINFDDSYTVKGTVVRDGEYHTLSIKVPKNKCQGEMYNIRFDPFTAATAGDIMYIKSISFTTVDYPEIGVDNDMTVTGCEKLPAAKSYTEVYHDETENALALKVSGGTDVSIELDFSFLYLSTVEYTGLNIEYMIPTANSVKACSSSVYFATSDSNSIDGNKVVGSGILTVDGKYHTMTFDFTKKAEYWTGDVTRLRFDFFQNTPSEGDVMYIKRITFIRGDGYEIDLSVEGSESQITSSLYTAVAYDSDQKALSVKRSGDSDVNVTFDLSSSALNTDEYTKIFIRYMIPVTNSKTSYSSTLYFTTSENTKVSESKTSYNKLIVDGQYHTLVIDLAEHTAWQGNIAGLRFDYFQGASADGDILYIEYILIK